MQAQTQKLWILIRLHIIYEMILTHEFLCRIYADPENTLPEDERVKRKKENREEIIEAIEKYKSLGTIPKRLLDYQSAIETGKLCYEPLGGVKYRTTSGFFNEIFPFHDEMKKYVEDILSPCGNISYNFDNTKKEVVFYSGGKEVLTFSAEGEINYAENRDAGNFLIFMLFYLYQFDSGKSPSEEEFNSMDFSSVLDKAETVFVEVYVEMPAQ